MQEQITEVLIYIKGTLRYKWFSLILAWLLCLAGWGYVIKLPNIYTSVAKVHVDTSTMLQPLLSGMAVQQDSKAIVNTMKKLMFTIPNLEKIIQLSNLDLFVETDIERIALYRAMKKKIKIKGGNRDGLFAISYTAHEPNMAKIVVASVLTVFSEQTQLSTIEDMTSSQKFIENQINNYEERLREAEKAREDFKRKNFGLLPGEGRGQMGQLQASNEELETAQLSLNEAISKRNTIRAQMQQIIEEGDAWDSSAFTAELTVEDQKIKNLKLKKTELLLKYTENHPAVVSVDVALNHALKTKQETDGKRNLSGLPNAGSMANPYVQALKISINEVDAQVAILRTRVSHLKKKIKKFEQQLNLRLTVETEMTNLNRDYNTIYGNFKKMLDRREKLSLSEKVDEETVTIKFRITESPTLPLSPSEPKRLLLFSVVLVLSLIIGFGLAFLYFFIQPTYMTTKQLQDITGVPVLGAITMQKTGGGKGFFHMALYVFGFAGLLVVFTGLMGFEYMKLKGVDPVNLMLGIF